MSGKIDISGKNLTKENMVPLKIVLIDKDTGFLKKIENQLLSSNPNWEMHCFSDEIKALIFIRKSKTIDVVITNLILSKVDGISVLMKVMELSPDTVRILASEYPERQILRPNITISQQLIKKPYDSEIINSLITEIFETRKYIKNITLKNIISRIEVLPSLPDLYIKITRELNSDHASIKKIGGIISQDIGMSAKIIKLVNSPYFGLRQKIVNVDEAVMMLGLDIVKSLVLYLHIFSQLSNEDIPKSFINQLWNHGLKTARLAEKIVLEEIHDRKSADIAFLGGLLHDTGRLIFAEYYTDSYLKIIDTVNKGLSTYSSLEKEEYQASHADVGAYLLNTWKLPAEIVNCAYYHDKPDNITEIEIDFGVVNSVYSANVITSVSWVDNEQMKTEFGTDYFEKNDLDKKLPGWNDHYKAINADDI